MSRSQAYRKAKDLAGQDPPLDLGGEWRGEGSTLEFWQSRVKALTKQRQNIKRNAKALEVFKGVRARSAFTNFKALQSLEKQRDTLRKANVKNIIDQQQALKSAIRAKRLRKDKKTLLTNARFERKTHLTGDVMTTISHTVPPSLRLGVTTFALDDIREQLIYVVSRHPQAVQGHRFRIGVVDLSRPNNNIMSNTYQLGSISMVVDNLIQRHLGPYARGNDSDQAGEGFKIGRIKIYVFNTSSGMGSSSRTIAQATAKWLVISPKTKINCLYQSLAVARNFSSNEKLLHVDDLGQKARVRAGRELKRRVNPTKDNYADSSSIQEACNYLRYPINLYNNIFVLIKRYIPTNPLGRYRGVKEYDIQKVGIHCNALVPRKFIVKAYPEFTFPELDEVVS
jgi:hypothetical protein